MWKNLAATLVVGSVLVVPAREAHASRTGSQLLDDCSVAIKKTSDMQGLDYQKAAWCMGFLYGFTSANTAYVALEQTDEPLFCAPESGASVDQYSRVVVKYLEEHPEKLHMSAGPLALMALRDAFPCKD